jgi:hypothetical protein
VDAPAWFEEESARLDALGPPDVRGIPEGTDANTDAKHWDEVAADLAAARARLAAAPPAASQADAAADDAFEAAAQEALAATRDAY